MNVHQEGCACRSVSSPRVRKVSWRAFWMLGMMESSNSENSERRRKRRSAMQMQKRALRRGDYGRGFQLTSDMFEYFLNIMKVMQENSNSSDEMKVLASNVFQELIGNEADYCCNHLVSRVVENLLVHAEDEQLVNFLDRFSEHLRPLFTDPFASHVLQQSLIVAYTRYSQHSCDQGNKLKFYKYLVKVANFLLNNLEDFLWNPYSNPVSRTALCMLAGNPIKNDVKLNLEEDVAVPEEFKTIIKRFGRAMCSWPDFNSICNQPIYSMFLQTLLFCSKSTDECLQLIDKIISLYEENPLDLVDEDNTAFLRLVEVCLCVADEKHYQKIYKKILKKNLVKLAISKNGNFAVQKLIMKCPSQKLFGKIFTRLGPHLELIMNVEYAGLLLMVLKGCAKFKTIKKDCKMESGEKKKINIINCFHEMPGDEVLKLMCDIKGTQVIETVLQMPDFNKITIDIFFKILEEHFAEVAITKFGSRTLDILWPLLRINQRTIMADELAKHHTELNSTVYGRIFAKNIYLDSFKRNKLVWIERQNATDAVEKYFAEIIPTKKIKF